PAMDTATAGLTTQPRRTGFSAGFGIRFSATGTSMPAAVDGGQSRIRCLAYNCAKVRPLRGIVLGLLESSNFGLIARSRGDIAAVRGTRPAKAISNWGPEDWV